MFECRCAMSDGPVDCPVWRRVMAPELRSICAGTDPVDAIDSDLPSVPRQVYLDDWTASLAELDPAGLMEAAKSFLAEWRRHRANGSPKASTEIQGRRLMICESCDVLDPATRRCKSCGCPVKRKAAWADSFCPLGEWDAVTEFATNGPEMQPG